MAAEEHKGGGSPSESPTKVEHSFDELARALAEGSISRRGALKLFAGTALAALIPSRALAQPNKVTICHKPGTPEEKTLRVSESALGTHLGHGDTTGPCGTTTTTSTSTSTSSTTSSTTSTTSTSTSTTTPTTSTSTSTTTPTTSTTTTTCSGLPNGATCTTSSECCSGQCVEVREGVFVCAAPPPICDPPCPANCSCDFAADGTPTCIGCTPDLPCPIISAADCGVCTLNGLVCVAGVEPGSVGCVPPCTVA